MSKGLVFVSCIREIVCAQGFDLSLVSLRQLPGNSGYIIHKAYVVSVLDIHS